MLDGGLREEAVQVVTNEERREVAERLRELGKLAYSPDNTYELMADALGVDDFEGTDELFARLADLIEPEERKGIESDSFDREVLLALAEEYKRKAEQAKRLHDDACRSKWPSSALVEARQFAYMMAFYNAHDSILEACGEAVA